MFRKTLRTMKIHLEGIIPSNIQSPVLSLRSAQCPDPTLKHGNYLKGLGTE